MKTIIINQVTTPGETVAVRYPLELVETIGGVKLPGNRTGVVVNFVDGHSIVATTVRFEN